ncbi:putative divalent ion symporter [Selenomonas ruminantium subsp. lactilytica TAM6421]|uniref:Putative divalent ion symporter n=1 Tax=Selenomonas ruminantium subsp. lactilytica (strain NBRC 103574 / TAM6421) TaxID=927704 RepID=I0GTM9_SELRL|nr:ArsB/NhaD family transporter [Selenomonas ruminantium]BAL84116.1 putative divalent ion symporter [Selenomonas ruminantium subsp. lactilytica TAM6421]
MDVLAGIIFIFMYMVIVSEKIHRTVAAMLGATSMILLGILSQETALHHVDFNTLGLLVGMMVLVGVTSHTGLFDFVAIKAAKVAKAEPKRILIYLALITAVFSAFLDNVTTVLLMVPVTFSITQKLHLKANPFLLTQIIASNIGGTATLIGDPPNIMIGSAVKELTFVAFIENLAPIAILNLIIVIFLVEIIYKKGLHTKPELQAELMAMDEHKSLKDRRLLKKSLFVLGLVILGFFTHSFTHIESSMIALTGGFLLLLLAGGSHHLVESSMKSVEWATIFFFIGLFIAVGGLIETGIIGSMASHAVELTGGDVTATSLLVLWLSAIVSSVLDNIPFVATMIPLIQNMGAMGVSNLEPIWWSLALGACLGGNGTLVGASANLIVAGLAAERGVKITFINYFKIGFPIMLLTIVLSTVYVYIRYLI